VSDAVARVGGRLLLIDPDDRVLLIHERLEHGGSHWLTPGGGVEPGETPREAAIREAAEEIGVEVVLPDDAEAVLVTRREWSWAEVVYDQVDHFFAARVPTGLPLRPAALTDVEQVNWLGFGWWSVAELRSTGDVLVPADLADVLARVLTEVLPTLDGHG